ncbi:MAG: hypothetical protein EBR52_08475, partial [Microbacteriaceae bacterium]|nr:hypothetical protein [Microbacteriaceae bacterium]
MPTFYPSCVVNLRLRFDETLHVQPEPTPVSTDDTVAGTAEASPPQPQPLLTRPGDENVSYVLNRVPMKASVELPGYRQAGQFTLDLAFRDLPIDPRTVRAAAVDIHLGAVAADNFREGMTGQPVNGWRPSVLRTINDDGSPNMDTLLMTGTVDEWGVDHDDSRSVVTLKGRDMRGILLDTPLTNDPRIAQQIIEELDLSQPIDTLIGSLLAYNPLFGDFIVTTVPDEWPDGVVPAVGDPELVPRHRRGARGGRSSGRGTPPSSSSNLNFWDLIVRFCYLVGAIPYFIGTELRIRPARSIYDQARAGGPLNPTPFASGDPRTIDVPSGAPIEPSLRYRRMVYGRDIQQLSFERKMNGAQRPYTVRAVSVDNDARVRGSGRTLEGRWPPQEAESARRQTVSAGENAAAENIINVPVPGITSADRLAEIARAVYEEIGRGEMGGSCTSKNLTSFGGDNADPDLLRMKPGDAVDFQVDVRNLGARSPLVSSLTDHMRTGFDDQVRAIAERIGDENLARVIVATTRGLVSELQTFFRVANVKFAWSESGVATTFDFQNYVLATYDTTTAEEAATPEPTGSERRTSSPRRRGRVTELDTINIVGRP